MFTGACKKKREMDWQLVARYFTVKSTDIFYSVVYFVRGHNEKCTILTEHSERVSILVQSFDRF